MLTTTPLCIPVFKEVPNWSNQPDASQFLGRTWLPVADLLSFLNSELGWCNSICYADVMSHITLEVQIKLRLFDAILTLVVLFCGLLCPTVMYICCNPRSTLFRKLGNECIKSILELGVKRSLCILCLEEYVHMRISSPPVIAHTWIMLPDKFTN